MTRDWLWSVGIMLAVVVGAWVGYEAGQRDALREVHESRPVKATDFCLHSAVP